MFTLPSQDSHHDHNNLGREETGNILKKRHRGMLSLGKSNFSFAMLALILLIGTAHGLDKADTKRSYLRSLQVTGTAAPTTGSIATASPTRATTAWPTSSATAWPTASPTASPMLDPTPFPTAAPIVVATADPTQMPVAVVAPTTTSTPAPSNSSNLNVFNGDKTKIAMVAGIVVGAGALLLAVVLFFLCIQRKKAKSPEPSSKKKEKVKSVPKKEESTSKKPSKATKPPTRFSFNSNPSKYGGFQTEIVIDPEDDISTLGDPTLITNIRSKEALEKVADRFEVDAPAGKLGIVVGTHGKLPVVHEIEDSSVLADQVRIGDVLLSIDSVYVTGKTAIQISKMISRKSKQKSRKLVFARSKAAPTEL
eukprot:Nitzschia sp. Nitz4//scaffold235_size30605//18929//20101//NITZ4_007977-RA/size30605-augustus-gene-0.19-mRNA-1//-1//CDS//3329543459//7827//frame0